MAAVKVTEAELGLHLLGCEENIIQSVVIVPLPKYLVHRQSKLSKQNAPGDESQQATENCFLFVTDTNIFVQLWLTAFWMISKLLSDADSLLVLDILHRMAKGVPKAAWATLSKYVLSN